MTTARRRLFLLTESPAPSGVGEHILSLADGLAGNYDVAIGGVAGTGLPERGRAAGLPVEAIDSAAPHDLARWFARSRPDLAHVHAGIGWAGHASTRAAHAAGAAVVRTEHLPYLLADPAQRSEHAVPIEEAPDLLRHLVADRPEFLQIVFKVAD